MMNFSQGSSLFATRGLEDTIPSGLRMRVRSSRSLLRGVDFIKGAWID